jgi:uncharacterized membrane protein YbjE (DUF340 family)
MSSSDDIGGYREEVAMANPESARSITQGAQVPVLPDSDALSAKDRQEALQKLADATVKITLSTLKTLEQSSRWTLLFSAVVLGFFMAAAPCVLVVFDGSLATTTAEYMTTSVSGAVLALAALVGLIVADRGTQNKAGEVHEKSVDNLDVAAAAAKASADVEYGLATGQVHVPANSRGSE